MQCRASSHVILPLAASLLRQERTQGHAKPALNGAHAEDASAESLRAEASPDANEAKQYQEEVATCVALSRSGEKGQFLDEICPKDVDDVITKANKVLTEASPSRVQAEPSSADLRLPVTVL
jgi:hypothetical protein